ncbi:MAG TPA: hypothetical protein VFM90_06550, partial [Cyclobacteriaceae bacterium]|nr:hypothetical protein [Cyclobacteriaceae bacterium]
MKKYIVLVAGYDYNGGGTDFAYLAEKRRLFLLRENPAWANDGNVIFVRFDAKTGKVQRNTSNGTSRKWSDEALAFDAVNRRQHYSGKVLKQEATNLLSITDAYRYVINIGDTDPGSLHEFSILGHGWFGGPILLNSTQRPDYSAGQNLQLVRDPYDKDGRHKDFFPENMAIDDWIKFKAAFSPQGYCWVWGCVFTRVYFNTLHRVINSDSFKRKAFGTHADDDEIVISVNASFARTYYKNDIMFFPASTTEVTFNRTIGDLKAFLIRGLRRCYPGRLAADTG